MATIVNNHEIVSTSYNGNPRGERKTAVIKETTMIAFQPIPNRMQLSTQKEMLESTIFLSGEMYDDGSRVEINYAELCPICLRMIKNSGTYKTASKNGIFKLRIGEKSYPN